MESLMGMWTLPSSMNEPHLSTTVRGLFDIMMARQNVDTYGTTNNVLCMHRLLGRVRPTATGTCCAVQCTRGWHQVLDSST